MKKFIALLMALVMAMSLATVAWGATTHTVATLAELETAVAAAADGDTIDLACSDQSLVISDEVTINPDKKITIDASDIAEPFYVNGGKLTLGANVTIKSNTAIIGVYGGGELVVNGATIYHTGGLYPAFDVNAGTTMTVNAGSTLYKVNGTVIDVKGTLNIAGGTIYSDGDNHVAVMAQGSGVINMTDGYVYATASSAILAKDGGEVTISGGKVEALEDNPTFCAAYARNGGKITVTGTAVVDAAAGFGLVAVTGGEVTVAGGTVDGVKAHEAASAKATITGGTVTGDVDAANDATVSITGGTFTDDVSEYVAGGKEATLSNGQYIITTKTSTAGTTTTLKNADKYDIYGITGTTSVKTPNADITKKVTDKTTVTVGDKTTVTYTATTYSDGVKVYVEVDSSVANYKLTKNGVIVAYLVDLASVGDVPTTTQTVTSYVKAVETPKCGEYNKATYANGVYMIDGKAYVAGGANWALLNGKFVNYGGEAAAVKHTYVANTYSTSVKDAVATVKCSTCKKVFNVLTADQVKTMAPNAYVIDPVFGYIAVGAGTTAGTTGTVESAKTFDAGVAMYVGMSVMAAAGSAVVISKKKD